MKKILIIEDEKILSEMYRFKFEKEGYSVLTAMDVAEGLKIAEKEIPDLIILDILLPKESGLNFLEKRKNIKSIAEIPVIVMSNFDDKETREKASSMGAKDYMIKSNYNPKEVLERIQSHLK